MKIKVNKIFIANASLSKSKVNVSVYCHCLIAWYQHIISECLSTIVEGCRAMKYSTFHAHQNSQTPHTRALTSNLTITETRHVMILSCHWEHAKALSIYNTPSHTLDKIFYLYIYYPQSLNTDNKIWKKNSLSTWR